MPQILTFSSKMRILTSSSDVFTNYNPQSFPTLTVEKENKLLICSKKNSLSFPVEKRNHDTYIYWVYHIEMDETKWLWVIERSIISLNYGAQWLQEIWIFEFHPPVIKKLIYLGCLNSLQLKRCQNSNWYFMILTKNICFQNIKIKLNSGTWMTLQSSVSSDFQGLRAFSVSMTSTA